MTYVLDDETRKRLDLFLSDMTFELEDNIPDKGGRDDWLQIPPSALLHEITFHWAKLAMAYHDWSHHQGECRNPAVCTHQPAPLDEAVSLIREYTADVANCAFLLWDRLGLGDRHDRQP